jgi:hypothetical protein
MADPAGESHGKASRFHYNWRRTGRSTYLLTALLVMLFTYPFLLAGSWYHRLILGFLNVGILVTAAYAATQKRRTFLAVVVFLGVPAFGLQVVYLLTNNAVLGDLFFLICAIFYMITITHVLRYVLAPGEVTADKLHGAIAAYILAGFLWTSLYTIVYHLNPGSFSYNGASVSANIFRTEDLLYFSFATLTTTGYGDIAPVTAHARSLVILEQLAGTFYIAILIARLTGLYQGESDHR